MRRSAVQRRRVVAVGRRRRRQVGAVAAVALARRAVQRRRRFVRRVLLQLPFPGSVNLAWLGLTLDKFSLSWLSSLLTFPIQN